MAAEDGTLITRPAVTPSLEADPLTDAGAFLRAAVRDQGQVAHGEVRLQNVAGQP